MKLLVVVAVTAGICALLVLWRPPVGSYRYWLRNYLLLIFGIGLFNIALSVFLKSVGLGEYAGGYAPIFLAIGLVTAIGAATKAPIYWEVISHWGFWADLSATMRQGLLMVLGVVMIVLGLAVSRQERTAYRICRSWYAMATTPADSARVAGAVPDPHLRPPRRRFETNPRPPMTCSRLLQ